LGGVGKERVGENILTYEEKIYKGIKEVNEKLYNAYSYATYCWDDKVKESDMGQSRSTQKRLNMFTTFYDMLESEQDLCTSGF
jgi:hypothetical protein